MKTPSVPVIQCKSYAMRGDDGKELVVSETFDRQQIEITIRGADGSAAVRINGEQFQRLCRMDSAYDGLEVTTMATPPEPAEAEAAVLEEKG